MATATAMYHTRRNPLRRISRARAPDVTVAKDPKVRRLHKAFLRYHDPDNWPLLRAALQRMGRADLIGHGKGCLVPPRRPGEGRGRSGHGRSQRRPTRAREPGATPPAGTALTQHTGLPPTAARDRTARKNARSGAPSRGHSAREGTEHDAPRHPRRRGKPRRT